MKQKPKLLVIEKRGYLCGTAWSCELGHTGVMIHPSISQLKKCSPCWKECGIVAVTMTVRRQKK